MVDILTTRELAALIWITVLVVWVLRRAEMRSAVCDFVRSAFATKLAIIWTIGAAYMALGVFLLSKIHLWNPGNLKDTLIWCLSAGVVVLIHGFSQGEKRTHYKTLMLDLFKLTVFLEILLSTYCFSLLIELILFIVLAFTTAIHAYSEIKGEYKSVHNLATGLLIVLGVIMIWGAITGFVKNPNEILAIDTLKGIARPILLTAWLIPVSYVLGLIGAYEVLFVAFQLGNKRSLKFHILARLRLIRQFGFRLGSVLNAPSQLCGGLSRVYSMNELETLLSAHQDRYNRVAGND